MPSLALHQLTVREAGPLELVSIARRLDCDDVCVFTHCPSAPIPGASYTVYPSVDAGNLASMKAVMRDLAVGVANIEFFPVTEHGAIDTYLPAFEVGAQLGARRAVTHIHDSDDIRALHTLARLCDAAAQFDLTLGLEFMGLTPACSSIERAAWFVRNVQKPNIGIGVDALHLIRTGGTPDDIARLDPSLFCYSQLCDGIGFAVTGDYRSEGQDRKPPGEGDWPLVEMIRALPDDIAFDVEVPSTTLVSAGVPACERAQRAVAGSRAVLAVAQGPDRDGG